MKQNCKQSDNMISGYIVSDNIITGQTFLCKTEKFYKCLYEPNE